MEHSKQEERKGFYKNLFRFNALLDINIDEEEFQWIPEEDEDEDGKKAQRNNERLIRKNLKIALSNGDSQKYQKTVIGVIKDISECLKTEKYKPLDIELHKIWKRTIEKNEIKTLQLKGLCLLLITKYTRALLQSNPLLKKLSEDQDALTRFASANMSYLYDPNNKKDSVYLQILILLECAACASPEATIGFLNLADSTAPKKSRGNRNTFKNEFDVVVPFFDALIAYNKSIAYDHTMRKDQALESVQNTIQLTKIEEKKYETEYKEIDTTLTQEELCLYLMFPALHLKADLLYKMQCCFNAIETLDELKTRAYLDNGKNICSRYKRIKADLLEASCWLDMGDQQQASQSIKNYLKDAGRSVKYLHNKVKTELKRCRNTIYKLDVVTTFEEYSEILVKQPTLNTDAVKLILQCDLERWKSISINDIGSVKDLDELAVAKLKIKKMKDMIDILFSHIENLKHFITIHKADRFQRQNLKEIAVDWLDELVFIESLLLKIATPFIEDENEMNDIFNNERLKKSEIILECLGKNPKRENPHFSDDNNIANDIWGDHFKRFDPDAASRLFGILAKRTDLWEGFSRKLKEINAKKLDKSKYFPLVIVSLGVFLKSLAEFELMAIGLNQKGKFPQEKGKAREVYPKEDTFEHRHTMRRGKVLRHYIDNAGNKHDGGSELLWLAEEVAKKGKDKPIDCCLKQLNKAWNAKEKIVETKPNGYSTLRVEDRPLGWSTLRVADYSRIIGDSDFRKHLQSGRSEHPINLFVNSDKEKLTGVEFVALRRWNSHTPEISFSKGGGYFVFIPKDSNTGDRDNEQQCGIFRATKLGIAVDPGFDFIHNFFSQGFTLDDIDLILITHADADHINDYAGLADLFRVRSKPGKDSKKIYNFIPRNAHKILKRYITDESYRRLYYDTVLVDVEEGLSENKKIFTLELPKENESSPPRIIIGKNEVKCDGPCLKIECVPASHDDHAGERPGSFGYVLTFSEKPRETENSETKKADVFGTIGFTGDSQWFPEYAEAFKKCDMVCSHIGSVLGDKVDDYQKDQHLGDWEAMIRKKNHPYLPGEVLFLEQLRKLDESPNERIVVLSEFGEELKGLIRKDICERLNRCMSLDLDGCWKNFVIQKEETKNSEPEEGKEGGEKEDYCVHCDEKHKEHKGHHKDQKEHNGKHIRTIPADIGLRISVRDGNEPVVHCVLCDRFHDPEDMEWIPHGREEAMFYVCGPCYRSKSRDIRVATYESILDSGRPVLRSHAISEAEKSEDNN